MASFDSAVSAERDPHMKKLLRHELRSYIDFTDGGRKTKESKSTPGKRRLVRLRDLSVLQEHGRTLLKQGNLGRFTFNAKTAKARRTLEEMIRETDLSVSEF